MYFTLQYIRLRACLKKASRNLHILLCEKHFSNVLKKKSYISEILNVFLFQKYI